MITISEAVYSDGLWSVVAVVDSASGTFVGPFILDLPEDVSDADIVAAIEAIIEPPKPVVKRATKKAAPVVEAPVDSSEATNG